MKLASLTMVAAILVSSSAFAAQKNASPAKAPGNACSINKCHQIQGSMGWCKVERDDWCPRHLERGDACSPVPVPPGHMRC